MSINLTNPIANLRLTVAAVIKHEEHFLLVTDVTQNGLKLNQPAGHVEESEHIIDAIIREVKEETGLNFNPKFVVGVYFAKINQYSTHLRICFSGEVFGDLKNPRPDKNDDGVIEAKWYTLDEIKSNKNSHRTPLVMQCINDFMAGRNYPLKLISDYQDFTELTIKSNLPNKESYGNNKWIK